MKKIIFGLCLVLILLASCATTNTATGGTAARSPVNAEFAAFEAVIEKSFDNLDPRFAANTRMAILPINAADRENGNYAYDTITVMFENTLKYQLVERAQINHILQEQNFQFSGMVSDETAVNIGRFLGAEVIIIGDISGTGNTRRLVFRALDVETARIVGISSERF